MECRYSGKQIDRAGKRFLEFEELKKADREFEEVMEVLENWRFCHEVPLNEALNVLKQTVRRNDPDAMFAKRLKRYASIYKKMKRFPKMTLRNMQDIGGCRAILKNEKKLWKSVRELRNNSHFKTPRGKVRQKDYIKKPKPDGYRGYHLIGRFQNTNGKYRNIEIQLRTQLQHYWATALEIVDLFSGQALKSNQGDPDWERFFSQVSKQFAVMDQIQRFSEFVPQKRFNLYSSRVRKQKELLDSCAEVQGYLKQLRVFKRFEAYSNSIDILDKEIKTYPKSSYILIKVDTDRKVVSSQVFVKAESSIASAKYMEAEKKAAHKQDLVVALVATSKVGGVMEAYPNFFADSSQFLEHVNYIGSVMLR